eukprot:CAMPEP_0174696654 /NCGR_PEP_ID=MMETSP1094-20130205/2750_1 /TAXON_ID=156173 /ORGANISM="Chrysochromulina brevifilum, Strain UTEX LB 985" /LENGTH=204 /DNA_ID=CAMNT_0015893477 /DNA_START=140 /DNA_END=756 /DNA_ORIENTATION=+
MPASSSPRVEGQRTSSADPGGSVIAHERERERCDVDDVDGHQHVLEESEAAVKRDRMPWRHRRHRLKHRHQPRIPHHYPRKASAAGARKRERPVMLECNADGEAAQNAEHARVVAEWTMSRIETAPRIPATARVLAPLWLVGAKRTRRYENQTAKDATRAGMSRTASSKPECDGANGNSIGRSSRSYKAAVAKPHVTPTTTSEA